MRYQASHDWSRRPVHLSHDAPLQVEWLFPQVNEPPGVAIHAVLYVQLGFWHDGANTLSRGYQVEVDLVDLQLVGVLCCPLKAEIILCVRVHEYGVVDVPAEGIPDPVIGPEGRLSTASQGHPVHDGSVLLERDCVGRHHASQILHELPDPSAVQLLDLLFVALPSAPSCT